MIQGQATYFGGRSKDYAEALKYTPPALNTTSALTRQLVADDAIFDRFLVDTSRAMGAIAERRGDLTSLVSNANTTAGAIADESESLGRTLELAPGTLRKGNTTFVNLRSTLDDLDVLVDESKPATKRLPTLFEQLKLLTAESRPTVRSLRELISIPGPGNDLTNLTARLPRLEQLTSTVFPRTIRTLRPVAGLREHAAPVHARPGAARSPSSARSPTPTTPTATTRASSPCSSRSRRTRRPAS